MPCSETRAQLEATARALLEEMSDAALEVVTALLKDAAKNHPRHEQPSQPVLVEVPKKVKD